jgi:hypothetical protein
MSEQLSRDDLLKQRLWAATNDCSALLKELAALVDSPPTAGEDQEERMRGIEANITGMRWGCKKLREYKGS